MCTRRHPYLSLIGILTALALMFSMKSAPYAASKASLLENNQSFLDEFTKPVLSDGWFWIREDNTQWSLTARPGYLRINTQPGTLDNNNIVKNLLLRPAPGSDYEIYTRLEFNPLQDHHEAGLLLYLNDDNYIKLSRLYYSSLGGNRYLFLREKNGIHQDRHNVPATQVINEFKLAVKQNEVEGFYRSVGGNWLSIGKTQLAENESFPSVGLAAFSGVIGQPAPLIPADFDYFQISVALPDSAADLAKSVVGGGYLTGGKGWDFGFGSFADPNQILNLGYSYYNPKTGLFQNGNGLDTSGLILWSYKRASGDSRITEGKIRYQGADAQFRYNTAPVDETDLRVGDLLFFDRNSDAYIDHVAMYVGNEGEYDTIHASGQDGVIIWDKKDVLKNMPGFAGFRRVVDAQVGLRIVATSAVKLEVTDPDGSTTSLEDLVETGEEILTEIPGIFYYTIDLNQDQILCAPVLKPGRYILRAMPVPGAMPSDRVRIYVEGAGRSITLAENIPLQDIPLEGYTFYSTGDNLYRDVLFLPQIWK